MHPGQGLQMIGGTLLTMVWTYLALAAGILVLLNVLVVVVLAVASRHRDHEPENG